VDLTKLQERTDRQEYNFSPSDSTDTDDEDDSTTDPDIDSDDTNSGSEDDGYADGTKTTIARMRDRWERHVQALSGDSIES
jgi:hypothetical protein